MKIFRSAIFYGTILLSCIVSADDLSGPSGTFVGQILNEGSALTRRGKLNWTGSAVDCADNPTLKRIDCTVSPISLSAAANFAVFNNDVLVSSPTSSLNYISPLSITLQGLTTAQIRIDTMTSSGLLVNSSATANYMSISSVVANYLTLSSVTANYLQISSATSTYFQITSTSSLIHNRDTLQTGATFYVSSGTVKNVFTAGKIEISSTVPTIGFCGTSPSIVGNDSVGQITIGSGAIASSCTVTFSGPWTNAPSCSVTFESQYIIAGTSTTATFMLINSTGPFISGGKIKYKCSGWK